MARHGENIRKRKDGRWEGRYPVYSEEKGKKIYCSVYGRTYEEVREKLTTKKNLLKSQTADTQKIIEGRTYVLKEIIFTDAAQGWLAQVREKESLQRMSNISWFIKSILKIYLKIMCCPK